MFGTILRPTAFRCREGVKLWSDERFILSSALSPTSPGGARTALLVLACFGVAFATALFRVLQFELSGNCNYYPGRPGRVHADLFLCAVWSSYELKQWINSPSKT